MHASSDDILNDLRQYCDQHNLSFKEAASILDIPLGTLRSWFSKGKRRSTPSKRYRKRIRAFLDKQKNMNDALKRAWDDFLRWWETQHKYPSLRALAWDLGWEESELHDFLQGKKQPPKSLIESLASIMGVSSILDIKEDSEAQRRTAKIRYLMLLLADELEWFRDGPSQRREIFRCELDPNDLGYISSLINMLGDEAKFQRWLRLTTYRFNFFKRRGIEK